MTKQDEAAAWLAFMHAALAGQLAAESENFRYEHRHRAAESAAVVADFALAEFKKRYGEVK